MKKFIIPIVLVATMLGQAPPSSRKQPAPAKAGVDTIIELVQGGVSESTVIKSLRSEGTVYKLSPDDLLKLQKAGVSENIINVMTDPKTSVAPVAPSSVQQLAPAEIAAAKGPSLAGAAATPAPAPPAEAVATPYPPDLQVAPVVRKRRIIVEPFRYGAKKEDYWYARYVNEDMGVGIRGMLMSRLQQSKVITVLERSNIEDEKKRSDSSISDLATGLKPHIWGADCILTGDITVVGRDDKKKHNGGGGAGIGQGLGGILGGIGVNKEEDKAVVNLQFRIADAETSESIMSGGATGTSSRKGSGVTLGGLGIGGGGAAGGVATNGTSRSNFADTIQGEATLDAVNQIAEQIEAQISEVPLKAREIEGRVAGIGANGVYVAVGKDDGVLLGDRFEIRRIDNEVLDPQTKERIALEAVKVGELVVTEVSDKHAAIGNYGGQPLSANYVTALGKGYQARLISK